MSDLLDIDKNVKVIKDILRWVPVVIGGYLAKNVDLGLGIIIVIMTGSYYLGSLIANWYSNRKTINKKVVSIVSWTNLISWTLPPLGVFTASLTYGLSNCSEITSRKKYKILALIGAVLSIINGGLAIVL